MSDYNWWHGPNCHTKETQSRVRGSKGNKVLRTIRIKENRYGNYQSGIWNNFMHEHWNEFIALHPRTECLETPIEVEVETRTDYFGNPYKQKAIREVDNA